MADTLPRETAPAAGPEPSGGLLRDLLRLYLNPGPLFADLPRWNRSASALVLLMALYAVYGLGVVSTGVGDYEAEMAAQHEIARLPDQPRNDENAEELDRKRDALEKGAVFGKMVGRVGLVLGGPVRLAVVTGLLAGILFVVVALGGVSKPDFHVLAGVVIFAAYVTVPALLLRLLLVSQLHVTRVETSAAVFAPARGPLALYLVLRRLDPFDVWFWALVGLGLWKSGQMSRRGAVASVVALAVLAAVCQCALDLPELAVYTPPAPRPGRRTPPESEQEIRKEPLVKLALKLVLGSLLVGSVVPILVANFEREPDFFHFKWRLNTEAPVEVRLAPVGRGKITRTVEAPGKVEADVEVKISSLVLGQIIKLPVHEGQHVKKDDLLVQLDPTQYEADVHSGESRVQRLKASIDLTVQDILKSRRDYERNQRMENAIARMELLDSRTLYEKDQARLAMSKAELIEAEAALTRSREDLVHTTIRSPLDGVISQLLAKEGEIVVVGTISTPGSVIMSITDPKSMVVRARVDENNVPLVRPGQKALVYFQNSAHLTLPGTVKRISPKGIPTGTTAAAVASSTTTPAGDNEVSIFETFISLDRAPPEVRLGMSASVEILVEERDGVVSIPAQAVQHRRAKDLPRGLRERLEAEAPRGPGVKDPARRYQQVVFVVENGKAHCRLVQTGISDENRVEVLDGLREGEQVIAGPYRAFDQLKEGRPVVEAAEKDDGSD